MIIRSGVEDMATNHSFEVLWNPDDEAYMVRQASHAYSSSKIPADHRALFKTKAQAFEQVRRLGVHQRKGNEIRLMHYETPGCFEAVADTKYGCEW